MKTYSRSIILAFIVLITPSIYFIIVHDYHKFHLWLEWIGLGTSIAVFFFIANEFMNRLPEEKDDNEKTK